MARQWLFHGAGRPFEAVDLPIPPLLPGEILVQIRCCMLCRSDLHTHAGRRNEPTPCVLGHEMVGTIIAHADDRPLVDARGKEVPLGQRITWPVVVGCGACYFCAVQLPQKCLHLHKYGHMRCDVARPRGGGLAEYIILAPGTRWLAVPEHVSDPIAASANCATATVAAVLRQAGSVTGKRVLIYGAGMLGLTAVAMCHHHHAAEISVIDPHAPSLARATAFGADRLFQQVTDLPEDRGADIVLELSGNHAAVKASLHTARIGGTVIWAGSVSPAPPVAIDAEMIVRRMLSLQGVHNYHPDDLGTAIDFLASCGQDYPFDQLVGRVFPLNDVEAAFAFAQTQPGLRVAVQPTERDK